MCNWHRFSLLWISKTIRFFFECHLSLQNVSKWLRCPCSLPNQSKPMIFVSCRGWVLKFATGLKYQIGHNSKSIWVTRLLFSQNDYLMGESFWPKDSLITCIVFELCLIWHISPVANFWTHPLWGESLSYKQAGEKKMSQLYTIQYTMTHWFYHIYWVRKRRKFEIQDF